LAPGGRRDTNDSKGGQNHIYVYKSPANFVDFTDSVPQHQSASTSR
jgi:hypothetical protein